MSLSLDTTGASGVNLVTGEIHAISTLGNGRKVLLPLNQGLFFYKGLSVVYTDHDGDSHILTQGQDYTLMFAIHGVASNNPVYANILVENTKLSGTLSVTYQALGGNWYLSSNEIRERVGAIEYNPDIAYLGLQTVNEFKNSNGDRILLDSAQAVAAIQTAAGSTPVQLTIAAMPNPRGASNNPIGEVQFPQLRGFNPAECLAFVLAANGDYLPIDSLAHAYTYNGNGDKLTDTVVYNAATYRKTFTYVGGNCTAESAWEKL
jgi:hypothetical protein